jgi:hypothetical protein
MPTAFFWDRIDSSGSDLALVDDRRGLYARGYATAVDPVPHVCRYELVTDEDWAAVRLDVAECGRGTARVHR